MVAEQPTPTPAQPPRKKRRRAIPWTQLGRYLQQRHATHADQHWIVKTSLESSFFSAFSVWFRPPPWRIPVGLEPVPNWVTGIATVDETPRSRQQRTFAVLQSLAAHGHWCHDTDVETFQALLGRTYVIKVWDDAIDAVVARAVGGWVRLAKTERDPAHPVPLIPPSRIPLTKLARWLEQVFSLTGQDIVRDVVLALRRQRRVFVEFPGGQIRPMSEWESVGDHQRKRRDFDWDTYQAVADGDPELRFPLVSDWDDVEDVIAQFRYRWERTKARTGDVRGPAVQIFNSHVGSIGDITQSGSTVESSSSSSSATPTPRHADSPADEAFAAAQAAAPSYVTAILEVNGRVRPDDVRDDFWARFPQLTSQHIDRLYDELIPDSVRAPGNRPNRGVKAAFERAAGPRARWSKAQKK